MRTLIRFFPALLIPACLSAPPVLDADGDGYEYPEDCDDERQDVNPEAEEIWYDGVDQDCDDGDDYDQDGDGFTSDEHGGDDCDDTDADINPDAFETYYDGVNQNCDGDSDYDKDRDGYDSAADSEWGDDCDDSDAEINPGATETWYDGVDQDCDGADDYDQDGDGYPSDQHHGTDCDDLNDEVHPDAPELINDIDDDCDDNIDEVPWEDGPHQAEDYHAGIEGEPSTFSGLGFAIAEMPFDLMDETDLGTATLDPATMSMDGYPELLVSAPLAGFFGTVTNTAQAVYLIVGAEPEALELSDVATRTALRFVSEGTGNRFGATVEWVPGIDDDDVPEVLVGAPATGVDATATGLAYLFASEDWSTANGVPSEGGGAVRSLDAEHASVIFGSGDTGDGFGHATCLGNLSGGDGGDVAITAPDAGGDGYAVGEEPGAIAIYASSALEQATALGLGDANLVIVGTQEITHLGTALPVVADLEANGAMDLVAAAPGQGSEAGWAGLLLGEHFTTGNLTVEDFDYNLSGSSDCLALGTALNSGADMNGDGYGDLAVLCEDSSGDPVLELISGSLWLTHSDADIADVSLLRVEGSSIPTGLSSIPFRLHGDLNGDGYPELMLGSPGGEAEQGRGLLSMFYGSSDLSGTVQVDDADAMLEGPESSWFGYTDIELFPQGEGEGSLLLVGASGYDSATVGGLHRPGMVFILDPSDAW